MASTLESSDCKANDPDTETLELVRGGDLAIPEYNLGLKNYGSNCYVNAVLQCLMATGPLMAYLQRHRRDDDVNNVDDADDEVGTESCVYSKNQLFCAMCALRRLRKAHDSGSIASGSVNEDFVYSVPAISDSLRFDRHEDAHEYLLALLHYMGNNADVTEQVHSSHSSKHNIIQRLFVGQTVTDVRCSVCGTGFKSYDHWLNLSLDVSQCKTLQEGVSQYTREEELREDNAYMCSVCRKPQLATRLTRIHRAPPILIVQLNRFSQSNEKLDVVVQFPAVMDIGPHMADRSASPVGYHLYATINHRGENAQCGHYVAYTKRRENQWYCHNDETVSPLLSCIASHFKEHGLDT
ncbi:Ubiquitin carboxyl-terminal hydrolase 17-like protein 6 [Taenia crassiceps]|uniref:Ubiquitin carboxyl-terminal hydrolase 36 n=1 Tax=Taenia crassiceps TaxID=6207 RepID=A0ABR4Q6J1_9CEST